MTEKEYKEKTKDAVEMLKALNSVVKTDTDINSAQSTFNTTALINLLEFFKHRLQAMIEHLEYIDKEYVEENEYKKFIDERSMAEVKSIKWYEIPNKARRELMDLCFNLTHTSDSVSEEQHDSLFNKAVSQFKAKYNINKIEL